jgi:hypothetical protein
VSGGDNRVGPARIGYDAGAPWNACTGLGTPNGAAIAKIL